MVSRVYQQNLRTGNESQAVQAWLVEKAKEIPDLEYSIADPADVEQMACLLLAVLNIYFSIILLPLKFRPFIFAIIGASVGCTKTQDGWVYLRDRELATQLMDEEGKTAGALKQRIKRLRDGLEQWQIKNEIRLVLIDRGYAEPIKNSEGEIVTNPYGQKLAKGKPSRYRLDVLTGAIEILRQHQFNPHSRTGVKAMATKLRTKLKGWYVNPDSAGRKDPKNQRARARSLALSNMKKIVELTREDGEDPVVPLLTLLQEAVERFLLPADRIDQWLREYVLESHERQ